ncbi:unnamed protein product [Rotaria sp. Silwood1]|nr:unnamed protein product [Rotaria sp. Silwood1]CAF1327022.1 unnamed protein product [Rotaria sp. Silwood1]CAF3515713.1 unnamed protein product [Rotaria sp. Silwood1]CAF3555323.1 unnamed protein product [Rotaria sp. Silwood1]CAF3584827.1 unnamed protein product [Rotaria sp. Silwood1]
MSLSLIDSHSLSSIGTNSILLSHVRTIVKFYIWPLLVAFGLTGNCLSIIVLTRRRLIRTSTNNYLTVLAGCHSCYLIFTLLLNFGSHPKFFHYSLIQIFLYILRPLADFSSNTATWLIVCFTLERTLAVAKPIYAKRTCSVRRSRHLICTLLIICLLITLPRFFEKNLISINYNNEMKSNLTELNNISKQQKFFFNLHRLYLVFICIIIIWIPLLLVCICNSILIWHVHRSRHFNNDLQTNNLYESYHNLSVSRNKLEYSNKSQLTLKKQNRFYLRRHCRSIVQKRRVTMILIFCLFVALLFWTPQSLSLTYETLIENYSNMSHEHRIILLIFNNFSNLFLCINASTDFILYCFLSEKFARTCKQIIFRQYSNHHLIRRERTRLVSFDRTSFIIPNISRNFYQRQLAANTTDKYYLRLYGFYHNSLNFQSNQNKKWKTKFVYPIAINIKTDDHIFYRKTLLQKNPRLQYTKSCTNPLNEISNLVLDYMDKNCVNNNTNSSINNLAMNSPKRFYSESVLNV